MRTKTEDPDYRFFQDPDLPAIQICPKRISEVQAALAEMPFDHKRRFCDEFKMDIAEVKLIFKNKWSLQSFVEVVSELKMNPQTAF